MTSTLAPQVLDDVCLHVCMSVCLCLCPCASLTLTLLRRLTPGALSVAFRFPCFVTDALRRLRETQLKERKDRITEGTPCHTQDDSKTTTRPSHAAVIFTLTRSLALLNLRAAVKGRSKAAATDELKDKNRQALEKLREKRAERLPEGWRMVESRSRPGQYVYENIHTEERQAWFPTESAVKIGTTPNSSSGWKDRVGRGMLLTPVSEKMMVGQEHRQSDSFFFFGC